ncbi:uncharacterized protein METZ01_LOCUS259332 [marine metagenome]|uniref:Uncharacterized protein n=1 Tax=marine metagenome TaxID=408172 RepID=A0A382J3X8_9ZZZZ
MFSISVILTYTIDAEGANKPQSPNDLFILVDDQGWRDLVAGRSGMIGHAGMARDSLLKKPWEFTGAV